MAYSGSTGWPEARVLHNGRKIELSAMQRHLLEKSKKPLSRSYEPPARLDIRGKASPRRAIAGLLQRGWIAEQRDRLGFNGFYKITVTGELALMGDINAKLGL